MISAWKAAVEPDDQQPACSAHEAAYRLQSASAHRARPRLVWDAAPRWTAVWLGLLIVQGVLPVGIVRLTRVLVNQLVVVLQRPPSWESFAGLLPYLLTMAALLLLVKVLDFAANYVRSAQGEIVRDPSRG